MYVFAQDEARYELHAAILRRDLRGRGLSGSFRGLDRGVLRRGDHRRLLGLAASLLPCQCG
jgi:hypothetical protein